MEGSLEEYYSQSVSRCDRRQLPVSNHDSLPKPREANRHQTRTPHVKDNKINRTLPYRTSASVQTPDVWQLFRLSAASKLIDRRIKELGDWRGKTLQRVRGIIREAAPEIVEEWKWETPVWSHHGIICTGEAYKKIVKMTFAKGASLKDPSSLFNSSLEGKVRRAIDIHEGEKIHEEALKTLVRAAVTLNKSRAQS